MARYSNPHVKRDRRGIFEIILLLFGFYNDETPPPTIPAGFTYPNDRAQPNPAQPIVTWINHSTFLIEVDRTVFLTDPIWSDRCSPIPSFGPKRFFEPPITLDALPHIDYVLISHDHYDHLDLPTVKRLIERFPDIQWCVPQGLGKWFRKQGATHIIELTWWETHNAPADIVIHAVPAQHFSGRDAFGRNRTLWAGWVVETPSRRFYFAGDTGYNKVDFRQIGETFGSIDLSLLPIGTYRPLAFMSPMHVDPTGAVQIHLDVNSRLSIGGHWSTFRLSSEPRAQPPYDLYLAMEAHNLSHDTFRILDPGQPINW